MRIFAIAGLMAALAGCGSILGGGRGPDEALQEAVAGKIVVASATGELFALQEASVKRIGTRMFLVGRELGEGFRHIRMVWVDWDIVESLTEFDSLDAYRKAFPEEPAPDGTIPETPVVPDAAGPADATETMPAVDGKVAPAEWAK